MKISPRLSLVKSMSSPNLDPERDIEMEFIETKMELASALSKLDQGLQSQVELQKDNERLRGENSEMETEIRKLESRSRVNGAAVLSAEVASLKSELERLSTEKEQIEVESRKMREEKDKLLNEVEREDKLHPEEVAEAISHIRTQLKRKLQEKSAQTSQFKRDNDNLKKHVVETKTKCDQMRGMLQTLIDERDALKGKLDKVEGFDPEAAEEANRQIRDQLKRKMQEKSAQYLEATLNVKKLSQENEELQRTVENLQSQLSQMESAKTEAQQALHDLHTKINARDRPERRRSCEANLASCRRSSFAVRNSREKRASLSVSSLEKQRERRDRRLSLQKAKSGGGGSQSSFQQILRLGSNSSFASDLTSSFREEKEG